MVASKREALRALLGGRAGALDSIVSDFVVVVGDMASSNWAMLVVVVVVAVVQVSEPGGKLRLVYNLLAVVWLCGMRWTWVSVGAVHQ